MSLLFDAYFIERLNVRLLFASHLFGSAQLLSQHCIVLLDALSDSPFSFDLLHDCSEMFKFNFTRRESA